MAPESYVHPLSDASVIAKAQGASRSRFVERFFDCEVNRQALSHPALTSSTIPALPLADKCFFKFQPHENFRKI